MPMRFCSPTGRIIDVFQQHTHLEDDVLLADVDYSCRLSPVEFRTIATRLLDDATQRLHLPLGINFHPGNWATYSGSQGITLFELANDFGVPVWSYDQWLTFWSARDTWRTEHMTWDGRLLKMTVAGELAHLDLRITLPVKHRSLKLRDVTADGVTWSTITRYGRTFASIQPPSGSRTLSLTALYEPASAGPP
jgi:hypothetical protein